MLSICMYTGHLCHKQATKHRTSLGGWYTNWGSPKWGSSPWGVCPLTGPFNHQVNVASVLKSKFEFEYHLIVWFVNPIISFTFTGAATMESVLNTLWIDIGIFHTFFWKGRKSTSNLYSLYRKSDKEHIKSVCKQNCQLPMPSELLLMHMIWYDDISFTSTLPAIQWSCTLCILPPLLVAEDQPSVQGLIWTFEHLHSAFRLNCAVLYFLL